jgi:hypothetical protein
LNVAHAKEVARQWISEAAAPMPGFAGAFFHGSINWLADDAVIPAASDVDVMVVADVATPPAKLGKFVYRDVLLEVSYLAADELGSPEAILGQSHLAGSFHTASVILDPTGRLTELQAAVARDYTKRRWVERRCEHARDKILTFLDGIDAAAPFHDQVTSWLFATGVTTHVLLVAGLKNPTVRTRYLAARRLLAEYGCLDVYEELLDLLGCARIGRARVAHHLAALAQVFDVAKTMVKTPFFFASDISDVARPIALDGSREMIERGDHREAVFWIVATSCRCQKILYQDAPADVQARFRPAFWDLLAELGINSSDDLQRRGQLVRAFLPRLQEVAAAIMAANPAIEDDRDGEENRILSRRRRDSARRDFGHSCQSPTRRGRCP